MKTEESQLARDVLTNFIESGWYRDFATNVDYTRIESNGDDNLEINNVKFEEFDESTGQPLEPRRVFEITPVKVLKAMRKIASDATNLNSDIRGRVKEAIDELDYGNLDAETDSCIVQVAAFGEVVYG